MPRSSKSPERHADRESAEEKLVEQLEDFVKVKKFFESKRSLSGTQSLRHCYVTELDGVNLFRIGNRFSL